LIGDEMPFNPNFLSESIQLSVAPVFLLTAVAGMLSALSHRIARVIDRSRDLQQEISLEKNPQQQNILKTIHEEELCNLSKRANIVNISMALLVLCAIQIGLTILELFFAETIAGKMSISDYVLYTFIGGISCFILALICLLYEVFIASYSVRMRPINKQPM
jgi:Protein of unknown function (DUF2721)